MSTWFDTDLTLNQFVSAIAQTFTMIGISLILGTIIALILAIVLIVTRPNGVAENRLVYKTISPVINTVRSLPFIILLVAIIPFTRLIVGTSIGTSAAIVPLVIYIAPYMARLIENSLLGVNDGIIESADAMGATLWQVIWYFILPEAKSSIILSITTGAISLLGATAMAGAIGGGGIGDLALNYGYQRFDNWAMFFTVVTLIIMVQIIQWLGNYFAQKFRS